MFALGQSIDDMDDRFWRAAVAAARRRFSPTVNLISVLVSGITIGWR
jgi:hypothetical protein